MARIPLLSILMPAVAGIIAGNHTGAGLAQSSVLAVCCFVATVLIKQRTIRTTLLLATTFAVFHALSVLNLPSTSLPTGQRLILEVRVTGDANLSGRWNRTEALVYNYRMPNDSLLNQVNEKIQLNIDTSYNFSHGDLLTIRGWLNPIDTTGSSYGKLMERRGLHARMYLIQGNLLAHHGSRGGFTGFVERLRVTGSERIDRLKIDTDARAVIKAMTVGKRGGISRDLRSSYSDTGAAHLLAVSGLHVGIVFLLINLLLFPIPLLKNGHIIKSIIAILVIWCYAVFTGMAPSVCRAAMMFSFAQFALAGGTLRNVLNILCGCALVMLAINPNLAYDASFLLSFTAVLFIILLFNPLYRAMRTKSKILNAAISVILVGIAASIGTAPMVIYIFGKLPLAGMIINPVVIITAHIIVLAGILWMILPLPFLEPLFTCILGFATTVQNSVISWSASLPWSHIDMSLPYWTVLLAYMILVLLAILLDRFIPQRDNLH